MLVSHDRTFLDNITKRTIEITAGKIYDYKVPYSEYVVQMQERRASQMASLTNQQRQVAQIEAFYLFTAAAFRRCTQVLTSLPAFSVRKSPRDGVPLSAK